MLVKPRGGTPTAPYEIREVVEMYARESGRSASIHFAPEIGWFARLTLRPEDRRLSLVQEQKAPEVFEDVFFHVHIRDYEPHKHPAIKRPSGDSRQQVVPLDIRQLGASGVKEFLEAGNTWSGRGVFKSQADAVKKSNEANKLLKERNREDAKNNAAARWKDSRRKRLKIPFFPVAINLKKKEK